MLKQTHTYTNRIFIGLGFSVTIIIICGSSKRPMPFTGSVTPLSTDNLELELESEKNTTMPLPCKYRPQPRSCLAVSQLNSCSKTNSWSSVLTFVSDWESRLEAITVHHLVFGGHLILSSESHSTLTADELVRNKFV